jgi:hypothetical protein
VGESQVSAGRAAVGRASRAPAVARTVGAETEPRLGRGGARQHHNNTILHALSCHTKEN